MSSSSAAFGIAMRLKVRAQMHCGSHRAKMLLWKHSSWKTKTSGTPRAQKTNASKDATTTSIALGFTFSR
tara:strand:- start:680 stop:889 length:210 start_codon:yes stop_codon:yes gene_type:complete